MRIVSLVVLLLLVGASMSAQNNTVDSEALKKLEVPMPPYKIPLCLGYEHYVHNIPLSQSYEHYLPKISPRIDGNLSLREVPVLFSKRSVSPKVVVKK
jgi:hypothetical protein